MNFAVNLLLSGTGGLLAASSLAAGEALRTDDTPFLRRITPRMLVALGCLTASAALTVADLWRAPDGIALLGVFNLLLLAAGIVAITRAFASGPAFRGGEALGQRLTYPGKIGLLLLSASQLLMLMHNPFRTVLNDWHSSISGIVSVLAALGMFLLALGTGAAAAMLRSRNALRPGSDPLLKRLSPLVKGTAVILALALAVIGLASALLPDMGLLLALVLLTLGICTGVFAMILPLLAGGEDVPTPVGISSRGWAALGLLGAAGLILGAQQVGLPGFTTTASVSKTPVQQPPAVGPVVDEMSAWRLRGAAPTLGGGNAGADMWGGEKARLERELTYARQRISALEGDAHAKGAPVPSTANGTGNVEKTSSEKDRLSNQEPAKTPTSNATVTDQGAGKRSDASRTPEQPPTNPDLARLERELAEARARLNTLEGGARNGPAPNPMAVAPVVDLSKGIAR